MTKISTSAVYSIDYDGCIDTPHARSLLITELVADLMRMGYKEITVMIGSLRQSQQLDHYNGKHRSGSCYPNYKTFIHELKCELSRRGADTIIVREDFFTLPDAEQGIGGANVQDAIAKLRPDNQYKPAPDSTCPEFFADDSKLNIIYAQIHRSASKTVENIDFKFFDDRLDIHIGLGKFLSANRDLMPDNVKLHLYQCIKGNLCARENKKLNPIQGTGEIDHNYQHNIRQMTVDAGLCYAQVTSEPYNREKHRIPPKQPKTSCFTLFHPQAKQPTLISRFAKHEKSLVHFKANRNLELNTIPVIPEENTYISTPTLSRYQTAV